MRYLMVDRVVSYSPGTAMVGRKSVTMSEDFLELHFPRRPLMPGVLLLEALVQLAGWLEAASSDFAGWFLLDRVERCGFYGLVVPGDSLELEVQVLPQTETGRRALRGRCLVAGRRVMAADFSGTVVPLAELEDPEAQAETFRLLLRDGE